MSDHEEKNVNQPEDEQFDFSSMSIDELIASTKEEIARIDEMMGTSRLPDAEEAAEELPQEDAPEAGEVSLDDGAENPEEPKQQEPFEPKLPEEYADLSLDADEEPAGDDEAQRPRLAPGIKVLLYVCCVLAASVLLAVVGWRLADDVLALTKPDEEITITVPENATVADVSRELKEKGLIEYEWLFRFYCLYSHAERKIQPGTYELNHLYVCQTNVIRDLAAKGPCVIVGRCADFILKDRPDTLHIFIHSDMEHRAERIVRLYGETKQTPQKRLQEKDSKRKVYYKHYTNCNWGEAENYDLCLDSGTLGVDKCADIICDVALMP